MQRNIYSVLGFSMKATDGEIGKVTEFYFDDQSWNIRYLIVRTGSWLLSRKVLISPIALIKFHWLDGEFPVNLTKQQICDSPDIDTDKPVSRQQEVALFASYPWQPYWDDGFFAGGLVDSSGADLAMGKGSLQQTGDVDEHTHNDIHLRSTRKITGYHIHASDGEIGHVTDYIFEDRSWKLIYLVVDTKNWIKGKKVLIPVEDVRAISWAESKIYLNISAQKVTEGRRLDPSAFTDSDSASEMEFERETNP